MVHRVCMKDAYPRNLSVLTVRQTLVAIFSCIPISGFWNRLEPARCIDSLAFFVGQAVCNIILDIVLLLIPVFRVFKLSISKSQKVAVSGIFLIGAL